MRSTSMKNVVKSCIWLVALIWISLPVRADMLTYAYAYDQKAGVFTVVLMGPVTPTEPFSIDLNLKYQAPNAIFSAINFGTTSSNAISSTNVDGVGEVQASALNVKSEGGGVVAKLMFSVGGSSSFKGEIISLKLNGTAYGPLVLPSHIMGNDGGSTAPDHEVVTPLLMPPVQVIAVGKNHAVQVLWNHPDDGVLYYQVVAHLAVNDTTSPMTVGRGCVARKGQNYCTIRGLKNGVPVAIVATAVYPNGSAEISQTSNVVVPTMLRRATKVLN